MLILTNLSGLGAFLAMETKERAKFLFKVHRKQFREWCHFLAIKKTGFRKIL
jgi:hypothetical protein